ncbi:hypothetical protein [Mucilaginibacter dorajii]|uniref:TonB-dependent receptor-like beta-barrel domain-containing protein n=1 Tax=Mucilaginibacter dorajii TaxID=692994 RepID=A0ABP7P5M4_9SPHI|nr:hypothetical protein [Mucilaginibacter dorajii]MCS3734522.1 hypothetical protein [Mucilaginibacter dorajii]
MNLRYTYTLLTLIIALYFVPAQAQTKKPAKKATVKTAKAKTPAKASAKKGPAKPAGKKAVATNSSKSLGDAAAKVNQDTTKKGGNGNTPQNQGSISDEIIVTTAYKPVLADAVKIRRNPDLEDKVPFKAPLVYTPIDKKLDQDSEIKHLDAQKRPAEQDSVLLNNYVKAGVGSLKTLFGEAYFGNGRDQALQVGGFLKHFSQSGSWDKQTQSKDEVGVFIKSINAENTITGRVGYKRQGVYFYGHPDSIPLTFTPQKQHFSDINGEVELAKNFKDVENDFTYAVKLKAYSFSNAFQAKESNIVISGFLNQTIKQFYTGLSASVDLSNPKDSLYNLNNSILRLNPYIKFQGPNYKIDAGVNIAKEFGDFNRFYMFPAAKLEYQVISKYVRLFVEAKGDINRSSIRDFAYINPYIDKNIQLKNSVDQLDISAGLKGTLAPGLSFKASVFRNSVKDMPLLVSNQTAEGYKFIVIYDNGRSRVNGFNGELDFKATDDVNIFGRVEFKDYSMATEKEAWNLPKFLLTAGTAIHINNKVSITGSLLIRGNTYDRPFGIVPGPLGTPTPNTALLTANRSISSFADLSGGVEYKVTPQITVFGKANNILNAGYQTWIYYPNYGFNIFGGVGYSF